MKSTPIPSTKWAPEPSTPITGLSPFWELQDEMARMLQAFSLPQMAWTGAAPSTPGVMGLRVDISETEEEVQIKADLPGVDDEKLEVSLDGDVLILRAKKTHEIEEDERDWQVVERSFGVFERRIRVPEGIEAEDIQAKFDKGVLTVSMSKPPGVLPNAKRITVRSSD